jgi:hypothetical protein
VPNQGRESKCHQIKMSPSGRSHTVEVSNSVSENFCTPRGTKILARTNHNILGSMIWTSARQRAGCTSMATVDII